MRAITEGVPRHIPHLTRHALRHPLPTPHSPSPTPHSPTPRSPFPAPHRFGELKANPAKAKKPHHMPKSAREFASKFLEGYYSVIEGSSDDDAAEAKSHK